MKVEFYCGAFTGEPATGPDDDGPECSQEWVEDFDAQDGEQRSGERAYFAKCPKCDSEATAFVADYINESDYPDGSLT